MALLNESKLPGIPEKRYFTIGETSTLCGVKPHVLRYWEQEFPQLKPVTRRGSRRYYQHKDVTLIRQIRGLLYDQGFTISGARQQLAIGKKQANEVEQIIEQNDETLESICSELEMIAGKLAA